MTSDAKMPLPWDAPPERPYMRVDVADIHQPLVGLAQDLYNRTSAMPMATWPAATPTLYAYLEHVYRACASPLAVAHMAQDRPLARINPSDRLWVAFSGGKDGMAAAIKARRMGYKVILYHVAGINRSLPDERRYAEDGARVLGLPLIVDTVHISGHGVGFTEMPTKNQVIATLMAARMQAGSSLDYALGVVSGDTPETMVPTLNWSDNTEAVRLWHRHLAALLPGLTCHTMLRHETESLAVILEEDDGRGRLLDAVHGCMAPLRYRAALRFGNEQKYGPLLPGRCGSCTKCCSEYLSLWALGYPVAGPLYDHCAEFMQKRMAIEHPDHPGADPLDVYVNREIVEEYRARVSEG